MHLLHRVLMLSGALVFVAAQAQAQSQPDPALETTRTYDPRLTFAPLTLPDPVNAYRSSNGAPGPSYWQNEADYEMHADLDTKAKVLHNDEIITYRNNSPDALPSVWIHMDQNIYRQDARAHIANGGQTRRRAVPDDEDNSNGRTTEGFVLETVELEVGKERV